MSEALNSLSPEAQDVCRELGRTTRYKTKEWAAALATLQRAGLFPDIGISDVIGLCARTGAAPARIAQDLVSEAAKARRGQI